jgi:SAM-dependent methyltransferase
MLPEDMISSALWKQLTVDRPLIRRPCPVCRRASTEVLYRQKFAHLEGNLLDGYWVVRSDCGMIYADGIPEQSVFDTYYRERSKYDRPRVPESEKKRVEQTVADFAPFILSPGRVLDIGCGSGAFLKTLLASSCGPTLDALGVDPSPACVAAARQLGIPAITGTITSIEKVYFPFDAIFLIGVLEHIRELDPAVERLAELLSPGGRIFVEVPDCSVYSTEDAPFQEFSIEHINFFTLESLRNLMSLRGFYRIAAGRATRPALETCGHVIWSVFERRWEHLRIEHYIKDSARREAELAEKIASLPKPLIVWGVGTHTLHLLAAGALKRADVAFFVDSDPHCREIAFDDAAGALAAEDPSCITVFPAIPILICTRGFQNEIEAQIKSMELPNPVFRLY